MHFRPLLTLALTALAAGCNSSSDDAPAPDTGQALTTYVGFERRYELLNGTPVQVGSLLRGDKNFVSNSFSVIAEADEGLELDYFGNAYQASDTPALMATIRILGRVRDRTFEGDTGVFRFDRDRDIGFKPDPFNPLLMDETTLIQPKSVALAHVAGFVIVADAGDPAVKVWGTAAAGNVPPVFASTTPSGAWDVAYDEPNDRLYATLVDGTIAVFDAFLAARPAVPTRTIIPSENGTAQTSTSLRGIVHRTANGRDELMVTDIGTEGLAAGIDGSVLSLDGASTASGLTPTIPLIRGQASLLTDPSDLVLASDGRLRIADPVVGRLSIFNPTTPATALQTRYSMAPALVNTAQNANGIAIEPIGAERMSGVSDVDDPTTALSGLVAATSPPGSNGLLLRLAADLGSSPTAIFDAGEPIAGVTLDVVGDAYATYSGGGVAVVNRFATQRGTGADLLFDPSRDRTVENILGPFDPPEPLVDPRAVEIDDLNDLMIVADPGLPGVWVFGRNAGPTANATRVLRMGYAIGVNEPWGLDYDAPSDTLYVSGTAGAVYVYERFLGNPGELPDRTITPSDPIGATQVSTDLRGLVHDAERDLLILADAGATNGASNDGALFVIEGARAASGLTPVTTTVSGGSTNLDLPVDLAWNGSTLWVAENAGGQILRFDDLLTLSGDVAPDASAPLADVSSVELNPSSLVPATGGSIHED